MAALRVMGLAVTGHLPSADTDKIVVQALKVLSTHFSKASGALLTPSSYIRLIHCSWTEVCYNGLAYKQLLMGFLYLTCCIKFLPGLAQLVNAFRPNGTCGNITMSYGFSAS